MRLLAILIPVFALVGGLYYWSRDPLADTPADPHGFIALPLPDGADANTVLILTPPHAAPDLEQRAAALQQALQQENIPAARASRYLRNDPAPGERARFDALARQSGPIVIVRDKARANPPLADVIATSRAPEPPQPNRSQP